MPEPVGALDEETAAEVAALALGAAEPLADAAPVLPAALVAAEFDAALLAAEFDVAAELEAPVAAELDELAAGELAAGELAAEEPDVPAFDVPDELQALAASATQTRLPIVTMIRRVDRRIPCCCRMG